MQFRLILACFLSMSFFPITALAADQWQQPTAEELKMTSDPAAPDAPAVYLSREEISDDHMHMHSVYVRIKVLNEKGKSYADVEIPYESNDFSISFVEGRTIHSDGTIVPFTGKPYTKLISKHAGEKHSAKVFTMPAVEVGSIIEYRYKLLYDSVTFVSPEWDIQLPLYVHKAHFRFMPASGNVSLVTGNDKAARFLIHWENLPKGTTIKRVGDGFDLSVSDIPAAPEEDFAPPLRSFGYRSYFYYSAYTSGQEFWKSEGKDWSKRVNHFASLSSKLTAATNQITEGVDTPEKKLLKIYAAVMNLNNTDYTREESQQERKEKGEKEIKEAFDVWEQKRGDSSEIALLFLTMARAAGMKAYAMQVVNRDRDLFNPNYLNMNQLDDFIVIVNVNGQEQWFDPGSKYCSFGRLHWKHNAAGGVRQTEDGTSTGVSELSLYNDTQVKRIASLTMEESGDIRGTIRLVMGGNEALEWRQKILKSDEEEAKQELEQELNAHIPEGLKISVKSFLGKDSFDSMLLANAEISGRIASMTQTRAILPLEIFEARNISSFVDQPKRTSPVDLHYPYVESDQISITFPESWQVESSPQKSVVPFPKTAQLTLDSAAAGNSVLLNRTMGMARIIFGAGEYGDLRGFYQKAGVAEQQPLVLKKAAQTKGQ